VAKNEAPLATSPSPDSKSVAGDAQPRGDVRAEANYNKMKVSEPQQEGGVAQDKVAAAREKGSGSRAASGADELALRKAAPGAALAPAPVAAGNEPVGGALKSL